MSAANWGIFFGGGPKYFFSGPICPPSEIIFEICHLIFKLKLFWNLFDVILTLTATS